MAVLLPHPPSVGSPLRSPPLMASASTTALSSPTSSVFSESSSLLDEIRRWDESKVAEWLRSVNCAKYTRLFEENHINGEALLEVDQNVVKELGITKVGDRVRLFVAIKALRNKCYAAARKNKPPLAYQDQSSVTPLASLSAAPSPSFPSPRPESPIDPSYSHSSRYAQSSAFPTSSQPPTSQPKYGPSPSPSNPTSRSVSQTTLAPTAHPSEPLKQNMVKFIFQQGHTKTVDISGCFNAESIVKKGIRKFGSKDQAENWTVFVTTDTGSARKVEDMELVAICHTFERPERERLILVRVGQVPSTEEYQKSIHIAREQIAREVPQRPGTYIDRNDDQISSFRRSIAANQSTPQLPPPPRRIHADESADGSFRKTMRNFFGQRPPSELISSNLAEYFPGHESRVLEQTVRNSIRRSKRISGMSKRISVATTASYASSNRESLPPVPTVGETWLNAGSFQQPVQPQNTGGSSRKSALLTSSPPSRTSSTFRRIGTHRSTNSGTSLILADDDSDIRRSPIDGPAVDEEDLYARHVSSPSTSRPFSVFSRADTINSALSDNNSYIEVDNVEDIPEEMSDAEYDAGEIDGGPTRWIKGALIGSGSFGSVVLGLNALTGELMAVKQVELTKNDKQSDPARKKAMIDALQREVQLLRDLHHENIVQYLGSNSDGQYLNIFLEYVPGGSVAALLTNYGQFEEPLIRTFVRQILCGLCYLHDKDIIHRDIKGANVLVDNKGKIKISDFGISKRVEAGLLSNNQHHRPSLQGSVYWMAPEVVKQTSYTRKADIWSLGCLIVEMFTGTHPFPEFSQMQALFKIGTFCAPEVPKESTSEANEFLARTFEFDHEKRPTAQELLVHPFLSPIVSGRAAAAASQGGAMAEGLAAVAQFVK
ncbi:kinase-like domain-containing protein [Lipomyces tetrasporus]|uniref:mitogen-activated protein kinase kinase kinase n=1 Tax=Lipomyces tetrasporus TaxID=54092 RepID=A0AAD7VR97_9ASCO|nr:kinase-like domain-containing protein [Lipomyces tetrasporus]KAJ8099772.1 kinase-like domain-containing protein [Lipomyces tetrasporus]